MPNIQYAVPLPPTHPRPQCKDTVFKIVCAVIYIPSPKRAHSSQAGCAYDKTSRTCMLPTTQRNSDVKYSFLVHLTAIPISHHTSHRFQNSNQFNAKFVAVWPNRLSAFSIFASLQSSDALVGISRYQPIFYGRISNPHEYKQEH